MDKYDEAIKYLKQNPHEIQDAWNYPKDHKAGCLFNYCGPEDGSGGHCGCLTQVRHNGFRAATSQLQAAIAADDRIPEKHDISVEHLPVFAEWQRKLDKELGR